MTTEIERNIINKALTHVGLITRKEQDFVEDVGRMDEKKPLTPGQRKMLLDIGERKLNMGPFDRSAPQREQKIDYKARAYK